MRRLILPFALLFTYHFVSAQIEINNFNCCYCEKEVETKNYNAGKDRLELYPEYQTYRLTFDHYLCYGKENVACKRSYGRYTETDSTIVLHSWLQKGERTPTQQFILRYLHEKSLVDFDTIYANYLQKKYRLYGLSALFGEKMPEKAFEFYGVLQKQISASYNEIPIEKRTACAGLLVIYPHDSLIILQEFFYLSNCVLEKKGGGALVSRDSQLTNYVFDFNPNEQYNRNKCWSGEWADFACFKAAIRAYYKLCLPLWE